MKIEIAQKTPDKKEDANSSAMRVSALGGHTAAEIAEAEIKVKAAASKAKRATAAKKRAVRQAVADQKAANAAEGQDKKPAKVKQAEMKAAKHVEIKTVEVKAEKPAEVKTAEAKADKPAEVKTAEAKAEKPAEVKTAEAKAEKPVEVKTAEVKAETPAEVKPVAVKAEKPAAVKKTAKPAAAKKPAAKTAKPAAKKPAAKKAAAKPAGKKKPTALIIMDGFGHREEKDGNAILAAKTPNLDKIFKENPLTYIGASGQDVGLPDGQMGNSEVGHTNIGAGRIVYQELTRITKSVRDGDFFSNPALMGAIDQCKWFHSTLHIFGLLSDGGVHSHIDHMFALLELARRNGLRKVCFHCFMDGRDTPPQSGIEYIDRLQHKINTLELGCIATIEGRYYAMDRDNRWDRVEKAYKAIAEGEGKHASSAHEAMQASYDAGVTDEFVEPVIITEGATVKDDDAVIFANFRPDRAREITRAFVDHEFTAFKRQQRSIHYVCMTQYDVTIPGVEVAFKPQSLTNTFGEYISDKGLTQLRIAETEKYAHVTFFFNGGVEKEYKNEDRALIPSPKVATYDLQPEMSEPAVTEECVKRILSGKYDMIVLNFANCDMVGHTGVFDAAVKAVEAVDDGMGKVVAAIREMGGQALVTADHGNVDQMYDADEKTPFTAHTTNPVPLVMIGHEGKLMEGGVLADLAPTLLEMMGLDKPEEMTGHSLLVK